MSERLVGGERDGGCGEGSGLASQGAGGAAFGTGLLVAQRVGLLLQEKSENAFGQPGGGGVGELLHGVAIDVESGSLFAESTSCDNFGPASGQGADFLKEFRGKFTARHGESCLVLAVMTREEDLGPL
jgi:hypothetical protein